MRDGSNRGLVVLWRRICSSLLTLSFHEINSSRAVKVKKKKCINKETKLNHT